MTRTHRATLLLFAGVILTAPDVSAQQASNLPTPRLMTVFPMGARAGATVEVTLTGTELDDDEKLVFSHPEIKAEPIDEPGPPADPKKPPPPQGRKPKLSLKFKVTVPANVPPGQYDLRFVGKFGISNARAFVVGDLNEFNEKEPNNDLPQAQKIELNTTVNGAISAPTDVDYFAFSGKKGQRVLVSCLGSSIDSRLHAWLQVYNAKSRLVGESRNYSGNDALVDLTLPADGDYNIRLTHFTHTGANAEYFYRLSLTTGPWIDAVFPPVVEPGKPAQVTVYGRNLPGGQPDPAAVLDGVVLEKMALTVNPPADPSAQTFNGYLSPLAANLDGFEVRVKNAVGSSNPYFVVLGKAPVVLEKPASKGADDAPQEVNVPCEIAGRIDRRKDRDVYSFAARKGQVLSLELYGDRLGPDCDMYFSLRSADGKQTFVDADDNPEPTAFKFYARSDDPTSFRFTAPADGKYQLVIGSKTGSILYGPRHVYRMRITPELPDFRLVVVPGDTYRPGTVTLYKGGNEAMAVLIARQDGFEGDVRLTVEGLPAGVTCPPQVLGTGLRETQLVLTGAAGAADWVGDIKVKGTATIGGKGVTREARVGGVTWPVNPGQNVPRLSRVERSLGMAVRGQAPYQVTASLDKAQVVQGEPVTLTLKLNRISPDFKTPLQLLSFNVGGSRQVSLPRGLNIPQANIAPGKTDAAIKLNIPANVPPGAFNLVMKAQAQMPFATDSAGKNKKNIQVVLPTTPVTLTIIPKSLANVTLSSGQVNAKAGQTAEISVRLQRQFNFDDEFKVELVLPPNTQGLKAASATIPAGQNEVKLAIPVAADAKPGNRPNLTVKVTAVFEKMPIVHEKKFNLNVTK